MAVHHACEAAAGRPLRVVIRRTFSVAMRLTVGDAEHALFLAVRWELQP